MTSDFSSFYSLNWHSIKISLTNTRNKFAKQHPLFVLDAIFKSALRKSGQRGLKYCFHPIGKTFGNRMRKSFRYDVEFIFPEAEPQNVDAFIDGLTDHLADPENNFELCHVGQVCNEQLAEIESVSPVNGSMNEVCLEFQTPFAFTPADKTRGWMIDKERFFSSLCRQVNNLFGLNFELEPEFFAEVEVHPYYWVYEQFGQKSKSGAGVRYINGMTGPLYLKGRLEKIMPLLQLCSQVHAGRRGATGLGFYLLKAEVPYFDALLRDDYSLGAAASRLDRDNDFSASLERDYGSIGNAVFAMRDHILNGEFQCSPAAPFEINKPLGGRRTLGTFSSEDSLAQKLLHRLLSPVLDRMFEHSSVGFRKGRSREDAKRMIQQAIRQGCRYVFESDIDSFFDDIDRSTMLRKLRGVLPQADKMTFRALESCINAGLENEVDSTKGLVQGSSLSPLLSNLYLDSVDERMDEHGYRFIRYADDFVVLAHSEDEWRKACEDMQDSLEPLGLQLKEGKTHISCIDPGFKFLGIELDSDLAWENIEQAHLKRTVYVCNHFASLGVDVDCLAIRKSGSVIARVPFERTNEIVVYGNSAVSTKLIQKCSYEKIPITFCTPSGHYTNTLYPESKNFHVISGQHLARHNSMVQVERELICKRLISAKINNYIKWLSSRELHEDVISNLEYYLKRVSQATAKEHLFGIEGNAAKVCFAALNDLILDDSFRSENRIKLSKPDRLNTLLDCCYSLLFNRINSMLRVRGMNPYLGILHSDENNYESLVADLQEPFRARMDRFAVRLLNKNIITEKDFENVTPIKFKLSGRSMGKVLEHFEREMCIRIATESGTFAQLVDAQVQNLRNWVYERDDLKFFRSGERNLTLGEVEII
ncbi:CRISPR-associated endonuclease Cas1 [Maridesulfovibrio bastinii]|uniref:CRISPR-associated endonuclease Cas1 n=1 Tax=Maridesulfovibrio bastinii TaxID=47157 RepID=UPI000417FEAF|nr:CRISPR-associated endonuclease Cas1 [Maridesulfovibrio bastinii]